MKITDCKSNKKVQKKLLGFFVPEVTDRAAANLLEIHPGSAALFYRNIRQVIACHSELQTDEVFDGSVEPDESCSGGQRKGKHGRGAAGKAAVFGF